MISEKEKADQSSADQIQEKKGAGAHIRRWAPQMALSLLKPYPQLFGIFDKFCRWQVIIDGKLGYESIGLGQPILKFSNEVKLKG